MKYCVRVEHHGSVASVCAISDEDTIEADGSAIRHQSAGHRECTLMPRPSHERLLCLLVERVRQRVTCIGDERRREVKEARELHTMRSRDANILQCECSQVEQNQIANVVAKIRSTNDHIPF